jgi:hypothetical protein
MLHYLESFGGADLFAKIDNDTMVPPLWLSECVRVMEGEPSIDLLGLEAMHPTHYGRVHREYEPASFIGGIGLFRARAFEGRALPVAEGRFGFTAWQERHPEVVKGWLNPALPVCLLDRVPFEPWRSLSAEYEAAGWQRPWTRYREDTVGLWEWWGAWDKPA